MRPVGMVPRGGVSCAPSWCGASRRCQLCAQLVLCLTAVPAVRPQVAQVLLPGSQSAPRACVVRVCDTGNPGQHPCYGRLKSLKTGLCPDLLNISIFCEVIVSGLFFLQVIASNVSAGDQVGAKLKDDYNKFVFGFKLILK